MSMSTSFLGQSVEFKTIFLFQIVIKEKSLSLSDLDDIWAAQAGKHKAIVKTVQFVHDLLAKLAWDFFSKQLYHLFECFQVK